MVWNGKGIVDRSISALICIICIILSFAVASKFGYGSARGDPEWIGLDHLRFGMDRGYGSACVFRVRIELYILTRYRIIHVLLIF